MPDGRPSQSLDVTSHSCQVQLSCGSVSSLVPPASLLPLASLLVLSGRRLRQAVRFRQNVEVVMQFPVAVTWERRASDPLAEQARREPDSLKEHRQALSTR